LRNARNASGRMVFITPEQSRFLKNHPRHLNKSSISPSQIFKALKKLPAPSHYLVAYSGGMDSTVLLAILCQQRDRLGAELIAVHVNHQFSSNAGHWENHCQSFCNEKILSSNQRVSMQATTRALARRPVPENYVMLPCEPSWTQAISF
jgi:Predicted ATPase of the PP-loop superfamily implicated in cell cycle control